MKETAEVRRLLRPEKKKAEHFYTYKEGNTEDWLEGKKLYRVNKDGTTGDVDMMIRNNRRGAAMLLYFLTFLQWILYTKWVRLMVFTSRISNNLSKTMNAAGFLLRHYLKPGLCRYEDMRAGFNYRFNDRRRKDRYEVVFND